MDKKKEIQDLLELYRNYLATIQYHKEYGDRYGDTKELIKMYEKKLGGINDNKKLNEGGHSILQKRKSK